MISYAWFEDAWERMSGDARKGVPLLQSTRKRLLTFTALLTFVVAFVWVTLAGPSLIEDRPVAAFLCGVVPFVFLPFPYIVLRTSIDLDVASHAYLAMLFMIVTLTTAAMGGPVSTTSFFLMLIPLLATLLLGIGAGVVWTGIVALTYLMLHLVRAALPAPAFELFGSAPDYWISISEVSLWNAIMMALLALAASFSVANFRVVVSKSSALLTEAGHRTEDALSARVAAENVSRSRAEFIANVSHELRTPLNAIIGYSELLIETAEERGDETGAADNRRVLEAAAKLRGMVNDILKLSAIDAGRVSLDIEDVDIDGLVQDAIAAMRPAARARGNEILFETNGAVSFGKTDGVKLDQCLRTLLSHAITFTQNGTISVRLSALRNGSGRQIVCFEVEDTGIAVDQQSVHALFEPFAHAEDAKKPRFDGPNLDLVLSQRTARILGGDLIAKAPSAGGLHFTLTAPIRVAAPPETQRPK